MAEDTLTLEDVKKMAADIGMTRLTDEHLEQLHRAARLARSRRGSLRSGELTYADEPAHVFRLDRGGK
jgi:hypothetical protein